MGTGRKGVYNHHAATEGFVLDLILKFGDKAESQDQLPGPPHVFSNVSSDFPWRCWPLDTARAESDPTDSFMGAATNPRSRPRGGERVFSGLWAPCNKIKVPKFGFGAAFPQYKRTSQSAYFCFCFVCVCGFCCFGHPKFCPTVRVTGRNLTSLRPREGWALLFLYKCFCITPWEYTHWVLTPFRHMSG